MIHDFGSSETGADSRSVKNPHVQNYNVQRVFCLLMLMMILLALRLHAQQYGSVKVSQPSPTYGLSSVEFVDSVHGWAGGGAIYRRTDGGSTWTAFGVPMVPKSISMIDSLRGWAAGDDGSFGRIYYTSNGGASWSKQWELYPRQYVGTSALTLEKNITIGGTWSFSPDTAKKEMTLDK